MYNYYWNTTAGDNCTEDSVRLLGVESASEGIVQICHNGVWSAVCHDTMWTNEEANVVCRQLRLADSNQSVFFAVEWN